MTNERARLIEENMKLADSIARKVCNKRNYEDVKSQAYLILVELVDQWLTKDHKVQLEVFIVNNLKTKLIKYIKSSEGLIYIPFNRISDGVKIECIFFDEYMEEWSEVLEDSQADIEAMIEINANLKMLYDAINNLPERKRAIMLYILKTDNDFQVQSENALAKMYGLTRSAISKIYNTTVKQLRSELAYAV